MLFPSATTLCNPIPFTTQHGYTRFDLQMQSKSFNYSYDFDAADADVILVTGGGYPAEIRAHWCVLTAASPFFRDMFSLPQPPSLSSCSPSASDAHIPRIPIPETRDVFTKLLSYIYPVPRPNINSLDEVSCLLSAALKYDFIIAVEALKQMLISSRYLNENPLRVYGIATSFDVRFPLILLPMFPG